MENQHPASSVVIIIMPRIRNAQATKVIDALCFIFLSFVYSANLSK